jgi:hypothetical protein
MFSIFGLLRGDFGIIMRGVVAKYKTLLVVVVDISNLLNGIDSKVKSASGY